MLVCMMMMTIIMMRNSLRVPEGERDTDSLYMQCLESMCEKRVSVWSHDIAEEEMKRSR